MDSFYPYSLFEIEATTSRVSYPLS